VELLPAVIELCCAAGWRLELPADCRDVTNAPSALVELRRLEVEDSEEANADVCTSKALAQAKLAAEYQIRAIGAGSEEACTSSFRRAAQRGFSGGQLNFGSALAAGVGTPKDEAAAELWFRAAAGAGDAVAQRNLGMLFGGTGGSGTKRDDAAAAAWYRKAAEQGDCRALRYLASLYMEGRLDIATSLEAWRWIGAAAERGATDAQVFFAKMHLKGQGVPQSNAEAARWLRRAAESPGPGSEALLMAASQLEDAA